jgi:hypothetical protein
MEESEEENMEDDVPTTHSAQDLLIPSALLDSQLGVDPSTKVIVCQSCSYGLQRGVIKGHFIENHGGLSMLPRNLDAILDTLGVPKEVSRPEKIVPPIQGIPTTTGWYCQGCKYAAKGQRTVLNHVRECFPGRAAKEFALKGRIQVVYRSPIQSWTVEPGYSTSPFIDNAHVRETVEKAADTYENPIVPQSFAIPENIKAISQYLKELGWLEEIKGYSPQSLMDMASLASKDEQGLGSLKGAMHDYMDRMRHVVGGMESVVRRWVQTPSG